MTHSCPTRRSSDLVLEIGARLVLPVPAARRHPDDADQRCRMERAFEEGDVAEQARDPRRGRITLDPAAPQGEQDDRPVRPRSEEQTSELQSLMRISYAVFCLKQKTPQREAE